MTPNKKTKIWIDRRQVASNRTARSAGFEGELPPVFKVKRATGIVRAHSVEINGPSKLVYECGGACASAWIEVDEDVEVILK